MDLLKYLCKLLAYEHWANQETLKSLRVAGSPPARSLKIFAHIVAVEWLYLRRLKLSRQPVVVWPELTLNQCENQMGELRAEWQAYLDCLTPAALDQSVPYVNSQGKSWQNAVRDMLMHIIIHSSYHRGQIAILLGSSGAEAPYTDFIHCIRQEFIR